MSPIIAAITSRLLIKKTVNQFQNALHFFLGNHFHAIELLVLVFFEQVEFALVITMRAILHRVRVTENFYSFSSY